MRVRGGDAVDIASPVVRKGLGASDVILTCLCTRDGNKPVSLLMPLNGTQNEKLQKLCMASGLLLDMPRSYTSASADLARLPRFASAAQD